LLGWDGGFAVRSGELSFKVSCLTLMLMFDVDVQGEFQGAALMFKVILFDEQGEMTGVREAELDTDHQL
jgi:hypothetical protein